MQDTVTNAPRQSKRIPELEKIYNKSISEIMMEYYVDKQIGIVKISKELHLSINQIYSLLKKYDIEIRHEFQPNEKQRQKITEKIKHKFDTEPEYRQKISESRIQYYEQNPQEKENARKHLEELRNINNERLKTDEEYRNRQMSGLLEDAKKRTKLHKEELYDLYWNQQLDMKQIANKLNSHWTSVQKAMKRYGISTRKQSEAGKLKFSSDEMKKKLSDRTKKYWQNPEYRKLKTEQSTGINNPFYNKNHTKETRDKMSEKRQELNESGWKPHNTGKPIREWISDMAQWAKNMHKGLATSPNKVESTVLSVVNNNFIGFVYNGDGKYLTIDGLSPDFVDIPNKLIIEVFGEFYHTPEKFKGIFKKDMPIKNSEEYRIHKFKEYGYDTLIIWDYEINTLKEEQIVNKIKEFINKTKV